LEAAVSITKKLITFTNLDGLALSGVLEIPESPRAYALLAHCFTCGKDLNAAARISRTLAANGIATLRFDFAGLGGSEGEFADSNFSSNVDDLVAAADYLRSHLQAPTILIGHSLGGAAVLAAAPRLVEAKCVVTIGAPAEPAHVAKQFNAEIEAIYAQGERQVQLAGRAFTIKRQFLEDIYSQQLQTQIGSLGKALLIFHSPVDTVVAIDQAQALYQAARHPKSFISLDKADHLLSNRADSQYVAHCITSWVERYLPPQPIGAQHESKPTQGDVRVSTADDAFLCMVQTHTQHFVSDEPVPAGGTDKGPTPYELLLAALGTCTSMTLRMYARRKRLDLTRLEVTLRHRRNHHKDCEGCLDGKEWDEVIERELLIEGDLSDEQRQRLLKIADLCPVHKTLHNSVKVLTRLE
jgi:putative redox protein